MILVVALHISAIIVSVMALVMVNDVNQSDMYKQVLMGMSAGTVVIGVVGATMVFTGLYRGWFPNTTIE